MIGLPETDLELEKKEIINKYRKLLRHAKPFLKDNDAKLIKKAFNISLNAHKDQLRKSGEPYIYHPLAVAQICVSEIGLGTTSIISALLHDVVEDTDWTLDQIEEEFNPKIRMIIDGLTKISGLPKDDNSGQAQNIRKLILTLSTDTRVILIKLADRLDNMRTLQHMAKHRQISISSETHDIYAPLAHRLGLYAIKTELEDLSMKYRNSEEYYFLKEKINETKESRNRFVRNFIKPLQQSITDYGYDVEIKGRPKSIHSIANKMKVQYIPFEEVYDLFAIRIIVDIDLHKEKGACWHIYSIVTDNYTTNTERLRDWINIPKANGYESLHCTVMTPKGQWVEVQIRSRRMDDIAEKGYAAHWKYKDKNAGPSESSLDEWLSKIRESLERKDLSAIEFVNKFRDDHLFKDEVYAFTPKGELKKLPYGATALDFAFDIHTEIGTKCLGVKINKKLVPLDTAIQNGDQIEILTSAKQKPNEGWLKFAVTTKAISAIKSYLKEDKKQAAVIGRETVNRKLKQAKLETSDNLLNRLVAYFDAASRIDFFYDVGIGKIKAKEIKKIISLLEKNSDQKKTISAPIQVNASTLETIDDTILIGEDMAELDYRFANCCKPIPGDDIFGFVTVSEGIKIHRSNCPNANELFTTHGRRIIKATWNKPQEIAFLAGLIIEGTDQLGVANSITHAISSDLKVNMGNINSQVDKHKGTFHTEIQLYINDKAHLNTLMERIEQINGIDNVMRCDLFEK